MTVVLQRQVDGVSAKPLILAQYPAMLDAVRAREDKGYRQAGAARAVRSRTKCGDMNRGAGAVDTPFGVHIDVQGTRGRAPLDAAVGQVETGFGYVEESVVDPPRLAVTSAAALPPLPRIRPASKTACPRESVRAVARI